MADLPPAPLAKIDLLREHKLETMVYRHSSVGILLNPAVSRNCTLVVIWEAYHNCLVGYNTRRNK